MGKIGEKTGGRKKGKPNKATQSQRGLIAKRNLETHAAGFGNNGFDRRLHDSPGRQSHLQAVSD